jgi:methyl-galactoside transport system substrate-binding protein
MKKFHLLICAIILSVVIIGIGGYMLIDAVTPKVGLCLANAGSGMEEMLQVSLKKAGYTVLIPNGENDPLKQAQQVEKLRQDGARLLIVQPVDPADTAAILEKAAETPVLFVGAEPENLGKSYFAGWNTQKLGHMQAGLLERYFTKADVNGDRYVDYMLLSASDNSVYFRAVEEAAGAYETVKLEEMVCDGTADGAKEICKQAFSKYGRDLELIFCDSSALALGAVEAVRENGRTPGRDVIIIGAGMEKASQEAVRTGAITAALVEDTEALCQRIVQTVKNLLSGKETEQKNYVDYKVITHENVNA